MATFYGTTGWDIFFAPNEVNTYYFEFGELDDTDIIFGGTASDTITFIEHPLGGQFIFAADFTNVSSVEFIYLPDTSDYIELSNSLAVNAVPVGSPPYDLYVRGGDGNDEIDASRVTSAVPLLLEGEEGNDTIIGGGGDDSKYTGGNGDDDFELTDAGETVEAGDDDDDVSGGASELDGDTIDGGDGDDWLVFTAAGTATFSMIGVENVLLVSAVNDIEIDSDAHEAGDDIVCHIEGGAFADTIVISPGSPGLVGSTYERFLVEANGGNDILAGGSNDDTLDGGADIDSLGGGAGDDTLIGGSGGDLLSGGSGDDVYAGVDAGDIVNEILSTGLDTVQTALTVYSMPVNIEILDYTGTAGVSFTGNSSGNTIEGSASNPDFIWGGGGNDTLNGLGGADTIEGEAGEDTIHGDGGNDILKGGNQNDTLFGGFNDDTLNGGSGDDILQGDAGNDTLNGNGGVDTAVYLTAVDADLQRKINHAVTGSWIDQLADIENLTGSTADDILRGNSSANVLTGGNGADILEGRDGGDTLDGGALDDILLPGRGVDTVTGGSGWDTVDYGFSAASLSAVYLDGLGGTIVSGVDSGYDSLSGVEAIIGGVGGDSFISWPEAHGGDGDDTFTANNAINAYCGGEGNDTVRYGYVPGFAALVVDLEEPALNQNAAAGDTLDSIENITYLGTDIASLMGDSANNRLETYGVLNNLFGRGGDDTLLPKGAMEIMLGGEGIDTVDYSESTAAIAVAPGGLGLVGSSGMADGDFMGEVEIIVASAFDDVITALDTGYTLLGQDGSDTLVGGRGNDVLDGGAGGDAMTGGAGGDTYDVDDTGDAVVELLDEGYDVVETTLSAYTLGANVERVNSIGLASFVGTGNALDNRFQSLDGDDRFVDVLGGADIFSGGAGTDTVDFRTSATEAVLNFLTNVHSGAAAGDSYSAIEKFFGSSTAGDTMIAGGTGRVIYAGYGGNDVLTGGVKNDQLLGFDGADTLAGGADRDTLDGGIGNDAMTGGSEGDVFVFVDAAFGQDTITDYQDGIDSFKVFSAVADDIGDFAITGNGTTSVTLTLTAAPANFITVNGTAPITIAADDFVFY